MYEDYFKCLNCNNIFKIISKKEIDFPIHCPSCESRYIDFAVDNEIKEIDQKSIDKQFQLNS